MLVCTREALTAKLNKQEQEAEALVQVEEDPDSRSRLEMPVRKLSDRNDCWMERLDTSSIQTGSASPGCISDTSRVGMYIEPMTLCLVPVSLSFLQKHFDYIS